MGILNQIAEFLRPTDGLTDAIEAAQNDVFALDGRNLQLQETITELQIKFEDIGWINTEWREGQIEFDRHQLAQIIRFSRLMFLKNPLINRGVNVQALYVFGQGVQVRSEDPATQKLIDGFWQAELNQVELTGHQALYLKECDLQVTGNLFFVFFPSDRNTIIRTIPVEEIIDIITNPEDRRDVWFFQRSFLVRVMDDTGKMQENRQIWLYPSLSYAEHATSKPPAIGASPIKWETPIYHVKVGGLSDMMFGVPETYQALDWARSYTVFLENTATLMRKLSKFAFNLEVKGGTKAVAAAKAKLGTTVSGTNPLEANPPSLAGSTFTSSEGAKLEVLKTAGAGVNPADGRYLRLMVAAAMGLPECYAEDTEVLTESGFMLHSDWKPGVKVACFNSDSGLTEWHEPNELRIFEYEGEMVHFRNAQTDILVTPNHRMWTSPAAQRAFLPALEEAAYVGRSGRKRIANGGVAAVDRSWRIETAEHVADNPNSAGWEFSSAVRFEEPETTGLIQTPFGLVDPVLWARFLGYWIAEGCATQSICKSGEFRKDGSAIMRTFRRVALAQHEGPVLEDMRSTLRALGTKFTEVTCTRGVKNLVIYNKTLWLYLRSACGEGSHTKKIPADLLSDSRAVRLALYESLMAGDGGECGGSYRYSTVSRQLADDMQRLAMSLGQGASVTREMTKYRGMIKPIYRVWIRMKLTETSCLKQRHVTREWYAGKVYCFNLKYGLYVTRRNGRIAIQGNTFFGDSDVGNHATSKTLDRPTELKFVDRQELWKHILSTIVGEAVEAGNPAVPGTIEIVNPEAEDGMDIDVMFPPILEHDVLASIQALTTAATLGGHASVDTIPSKALSRQMMNVLGFADIDELLQQLEKQVADAKAEAAKQQKLASDTALKQISAKAKAAPAPGSNANPQLQAIAAAASDLRAQVDEFFGKLSEAA